MPASSATLPTSARVHPSYLTQMQYRPRARGMKGALTLAAAAGIGYGLVAYRQGQSAQSIARDAAQRAEVERRRQNALLMDAYGDRDSLEALEQAMKVYETQQQTRR